MGAKLRINLLLCALAMMGSIQFANALVIEQANREVRKITLMHLHAVSIQYINNLITHLIYSAD
jgi:hypothetical protein